MARRAGPGRSSRRQWRWAAWEMSSRLCALSTFFAMTAPLLQMLIMAPWRAPRLR